MKGYIDNKLNILNNGLSVEPLTMTAGIMAGGAALGGLGSMLGGQAAAKAAAGSNKLASLASLVQALNPPQAIEDLNYDMYADPELYELAGLINPESMTPTELRNILINNQMRQKQMDVIGQYEDLADEGLSDVDRAALSQIQNQIAGQEKGARDAIIQNMAQRGMSGSGQELANQLAASQASSQSANLLGQQVAGQAQQARIQALNNLANLSGGIEDTDYERQARQSQAQDAINQFNVQNRNVAQQSNLANKQDIMKMNTQQRNAINQANVDLRNSQQFQNKVGNKMANNENNRNYQSGIANALTGQANMNAAQSASRLQSQSNMLGAGLQTGGTLGGAYMDYDAKMAAVNKPKG